MIRMSEGDICARRRTKPRLLISGFMFLAILSACASSDFAASDMARLSDGMKRLGASDARAACFAKAVGGRLDDEGRARAADIVDGASDREQMRNGVLDADGDVRRAFIAANMRCSLTR